MFSWDLRKRYSSLLFAELRLVCLLDSAYHTVERTKGEDRPPGRREPAPEETDGLLYGGKESSRTREKDGRLRRMKEKQNTKQCRDTVGCDIPPDQS